MTTKPGRKAMSPATPVVVDVNHEALAQASQAADQFAALQANYGQERDLLNQLLGQAQMAGAFSDFSALVRTSKLAYAKENKLYQQLKGQRTPHGAELTGTWEEFCGLLGRSVDMVDRDISNLRAFGEEALESMSRMGIGYREMRQYRKLPEDQKLALIEVAKAGDKEAFVELAEEIIARHAKEKETLTAKVEEAAATLEAKDRVLASRDDKINKLEQQAERKFKPRPGSEARTAAEEDVLDEIEQAAKAALVGLRRTFKAADAALKDESMGEAVQMHARQAVEFLAQKLADISEEFGIAVDFENRISPGWMNEEALAAIESRNSAKSDGAKAAK